MLEPEVEMPDSEAAPAPIDAAPETASPTEDDEIALIGQVSPTGPDGPDGGPGDHDGPDRPATPMDLDRLRPVYEDVNERLWRAVVAWSGSTDVADEAIAEAFAQAARRGDALRDPAAWVWRAAFRIAAGDLAQRRLFEPLDPDVAALQAAPAQPLPGDLDDLLRALQTLPDQQRQAVVLTDAAGFSAAEAGALIGTSAGTVRVQALRARRRLRSLLTPQEESRDH